MLSYRQTVIALISIVIACTSQLANAQNAGNIGLAVQQLGNPSAIAGSSSAAAVAAEEAFEGADFVPTVVEDSVQTEVEEVQAVFGANLFTGNFAQQQFAGYNPEYQINVGDRLHIQVWGAVQFSGEQPVDAQGNIFIPQVGPVRVIGTPNSDLNEVVEKAAAKVYTSNVYVYVSLVAAQPVKIFVTGNVVHPGLYPGLSSDSILSYLDRAGGIDSARGSYLDIQLKRNGKVLTTYDLYDFLLSGDIDNIQLREGDTLVVGSRQFVVAFDGLLENPFQIEFEQQEVTIEEALDIAKPLPDATHISIERNSGLKRQVEYFLLQDALDQGVTLYAGDKVSVISDKSQGSIGITVDGEHLGQALYVLPYGAKLSDLLPLLVPSDLSNMSALRLYRQSLIEQQREAIEISLQTLETQVLSGRSDTVEEATLRTQEARLILQFIERARQVVPKGQVVLGETGDALDTVLENGDLIVIPAFTNLISINGEVLFPSATPFGADKSASDYINQAGGYSQGADESRIVVRRPNGEVAELSGRALRRTKEGVLNPGDEILVLPEVGSKKFLYTKELITVIYQLALAAGVVIGI